jgi:hypothetical protein
MLVARYAPAPPPRVAPPPLWGDPNVVRERLGTAVKDIVFDRDRMSVPTLVRRTLATISRRRPGRS